MKAEEKFIKLMIEELRKIIGDAYVVIVKRAYQRLSKKEKEKLKLPKEVKSIIEND